MSTEGGNSGRAVEGIALGRSYGHGARRHRAITDVSIEVGPGEVVAVTGPSGSGKTTLLHLLGGLDRPDAGRALVRGVDWRSLTGDVRARFRRQTCGYVVQGFGLLPQATAAENVEVPLLLDGISPSRRRASVAHALERVDLASHGAKLPDQLSGGQQQRVAIARALINEPAVLFADEPTGNLDSATADAVLRLLLSAAADRGTAVVLVTHDPVVAARAGRTVQLRSGRLSDGHGPRRPARG